jgi:hypothetical protein
MRINFTILKTRYSIDADTNQYTLIRHSINQDPNSKNFNEPTENQLGYYSNVSNAVNKAVKYELGNQPDEISLREFIERYENCVELINSQLQEK